MGEFEENAKSECSLNFFHLNFFPPPHKLAFSIMCTRWRLYLLKNTFFCPFLLPSYVWIIFFLLSLNIIIV